MKDRVPGAPGQYKAVIPTEDIADMQAGAEFTITLIRDDQPLTEGTPYSKAAVLPDELAQQICPDIADPTPADALNALHSRCVESDEHRGCYYRIVEGEKEWINPPMLEGVAYRTTERHVERPVYVKRIYLGAAPTEAGSTYYETGESNIRIIRCCGEIESGGSFLSAPILRWVEGTFVFANISGAGARVIFDMYGIGLSTASLYATIWFTRG